MNENTISYKLNRINNAVDRIRVKTNTAAQPIENVATVVEGMSVGGLDINEYFHMNLDTRRYYYEQVGQWLFTLKKFPAVTSALTSYSDYFKYSLFEEIDVSGMNFSNTTDISSMFYTCKNLKSIDLSNLGLSGITTTADMFTNCKALTSINLCNFDVSGGLNAGWMFRGCSSLKHIDIRSLDLTKITSSDSMFESVPSDCLIIVKDDSSKSWLTSKFGRNDYVKTVAEYEASL